MCSNRNSNDLAVEQGRFPFSLWICVSRRRDCLRRPPANRSLRSEGTHWLLDPGEWSGEVCDNFLYEDQASLNGLGPMTLPVVVSASTSSSNASSMSDPTRRHPKSRAQATRSWSGSVGPASSKSLSIASRLSSLGTIPTLRGLTCSSRGARIFVSCPGSDRN